MNGIDHTWFWGCWGRVGHYLWAPNGLSYRQERARLPWPNIDGTLPPGNRNRYGEVEPCDQIEGLARLHRLDGWTCAAWWDRSVDTRHGSNAAIFARGELDLKQVLAIGAEHFPDVFARFAYPLR